VNTRNAQSGQAAVEYLLVALALLMALLAPLPGGRPVYQELNHQIQSNHQRFVSALGEEQVITRSVKP